MANPSGNQEGNNSNGGGDGGAGGGRGVSNGGGGNPSNGNSKGGGNLANIEKQLNHSPGLAVKWTREEQLILEDGLAKHGSEPIMVRYANIVKLLPDKTIRDVALRCRWMIQKKESGKRKKEDHNLSRKNKDKKEKVADPSSKSSSQLSQPNVTRHAPSVVCMDIDDGISFQAIGGATGQLLEKNSQLLDQIPAHFDTLQIQENINLFTQIRDNILTIMNEDMPESMKQMPPLPVKVNEELVKSILPRPTRQP